MRNYSSTAVATALAAPITASDTVMTLTVATGLPSVPFTLVIAPDTADEEIVTVTARSGTSVTAMSRGQESTTARSHAAATVVKHMVTGRDLQDVQDHIANTTTAHGVTGAVVGTTNSQTLTGKSMSGSANTFTNIPQSAVSNLVTDLSNKASSSHTHLLANVTDVTASAAEVNVLDGITASTAELNYVDGVTSAIQTQLNTKAPSASPTFTGTVVLPSTTSIGNVSSTELGYLDGVTSNIQTQLNSVNPVVAYASVYRSTGSTTTDTALTYPNENIDPLGFHSTTVDTNRLTVPTGYGGKYRVSAIVTPYYNGNDSTFKAYLRKNGTKVDGTDVSGFANITYGTTGGNIDTIISLAAGDYVDVYVDVTTSGPGIGFYSTFNIEYIGA